MRRFSSIAALAAAALLLTAGCGREQAEESTAAEPEAAADSSPQAADTARAPDTGSIDVHFVSPADGARLNSPVEVEMAAEGVEVVPAGTMREGTGHMHILVDAPFVLPGNVIPSDDQHIHYGDGSTTATLVLPPGEHVLRLQLADGAHRAFEGGEYRDVITVEVLGGEQASTGDGAGDDTGEGEPGENGEG